MPHVVIFAGGSGSRAITIELVRLGFDVTRVTPTWDSGGSSRVIRDALQMLSIGDTRHALMTIAHGEGRADGVVRLFNTRLADIADRASLERELDYYGAGLHPSLRAMDAGLRQAIIGYLKTFRAHVGANFDFRGGSLGNFVLTGAYLAHGSSINAAISAFRRLCSIRGNAWPVSLDNDLELLAELNDGSRVVGQHTITSLDQAAARTGIQAVRFSREDATTPNPQVLEAIAEADVIVFGPGSFYTSVFPHILVSRIAAAVAARHDILKVFIGNMLECPETVELSLNRMLDAFCDQSGAACTDRYPPTAFVSHVLANRNPTPFTRSVNGRKYVAFDSQDATFGKTGIRAVVQDFEDTWQRGIHDASLVASTVRRLLSAASVRQEP